MMLDEIKARIDRLLSQKERVIVAIDGNCTAGKTTLAGLLKQQYDCNVFHMDDFFLRPRQRTPERLAEVGGNVDYERFQSEVLAPLTAGDVFSYRPFDCRSLTLSEPVRVVPKKLTIIEGSYCLHPYFGDPYDLRIFLAVSAELQYRRILERPHFLHERFFTEWIPMEQRYFDGFRIPEKCDLCVDSTQINYDTVL